MLVRLINSLVGILARCPHRLDARLLATRHPLTALLGKALAQQCQLLGAVQLRAVVRRSRVTAVALQLVG